MNCHMDHRNNNGTDEKHKGHLGHILMMALCCGAPIIILLLLPILIKNGASGLAKPLAAIAPFICPLMMVFMIPMMFKGNKDKPNKDEGHQNNQVQLNEKTQEQ